MYTMYTDRIQYKSAHFYGACFLALTMRRKSWPWHRHMAPRCPWWERPCSCPRCTGRTPAAAADSRPSPATVCDPDPVTVRHRPCLVAAHLLLLQLLPRTPNDIPCSPASTTRLLLLLLLLRGGITLASPNINANTPSGTEPCVDTAR